MDITYNLRAATYSVLMQYNINDAYAILQLQTSTNMYLQILQKETSDEKREEKRIMASVRKTRIKK